MDSLLALKLYELLNPGLEPLKNAPNLHDRNRTA